MAWPLQGQAFPANPQADVLIGEVLQGLHQYLIFDSTVFMEVIRATETLTSRKAEVDKASQITLANMSSVSHSVSLLRCKILVLGYCVGDLCILVELCFHDDRLEEM